jgi:Protein of unknown function (DUF1579)
MRGRTRISLLSIALLLAAPAALAQNPAPAGPPAAGRAAAPDMPAWLRRSQPGPGHAALQPLVGTFRQHKEIFGGLLGRPKDAPTIVSDDVTTTRRWVGGGRWMEDVSEGSILGGPYWRHGWLGYSNMDQRFEWVTVDGFNTTLMSYAAAPKSGEKAPLDMVGQFTDQGVVGEATVGKTVSMRTVIRIENQDRHVFELYFTPPGEKEYLVDRTSYTRVKP